MVYREIAWLDPVEAARRLAAMPCLAFLDSAMTHDQFGRYSYIGADPFGTFRVVDGDALWNGELCPGPPLAALRARLALYYDEREPLLPPFQGGAIGTVSYEFGWALDHGPDTRHDPTGQTVYFGFYDTIVAFDHAAHRSWIVGTGWPAPSRSARHRRARARVALVAQLLSHAPRAALTPPDALHWRPNMSCETYRKGVERVKEAIRAGDIYQANIAQGFSAPLPPGHHPFRLYESLRASNPAPFAAYLQCGAMTILSSSPERFLRTAGRHVETRPIKGTARRSSDSDVDHALATALTRSSKDRAENVMIVDLLRNDLSRVCVPDSVAVPVLCGLETYAGVHHLVSVVTGVLRDGLDALDLVGATFPGGSITGAPKLRAMEIIADIEGEPRGVYCGAIGAIGFEGDVDFNIAIRTVVIENGTATFKTGGGITILSDADLEYEETLTKARRIFEAFANPIVLAPA